MFNKALKESIAITMCLCLLAGQTMGDWDLGILRASKRAVEGSKQEETPQKENELPTISKIVDRTIAVAGVATATFLVHDTETPPESLKVAATSDQPDVLPDAQIEVSGEGSRRRITIRPSADKEGSANVTVVVVDGGGQRASAVFKLTVTADLPYAPGEILVRFKAETGEGKASSASVGLAKFGGDISSLSVQSVEPLIQHSSGAKAASADVSKGRISRVPPGGAELAAQSLNRLERTHVVAFDPSRDVQDVMEFLRRDPNVESVELNHVCKTAVVNDPAYVTGNLWGLNRINAEAAWDNSPKGEGVVVAVLDTGVDMTHEDLAGNIWVATRETPGNGIDDDGNGYVDDVNGWDFVNNDNYPMDDHHHGTHVAGTIAAIGNNGKGVIGVAPKAKIMALKFLDDIGNGNNTNAAKGLVYATDNGADIINNSWVAEQRCDSTTQGEITVLKDAINYAHNRGVLVVAAAGNSNRDVADFSPAGCPNVIAVSATDSLNAKASFSNYGNKIDVAAPGVDIWSSVPGGYGHLQGTSMACPHVVGVAALVLSKYPTFDNNQIVRQILGKSTDIGSTGFDSNFGYGLVNAMNSLNIDTPDNEAPTEPTNLTLTVLSNKGMELRWSRSTDNQSVRGYIVDRSTNSRFNPMVSIDVGAEDKIRFTHLKPGTEYFARVSAYDFFGNRSVPSEVKSAVTLLLPPTLPTIDIYQLTSQGRTTDFWGYFSLNSTFTRYDYDISVDPNFQILIDKQKSKLTIGTYSGEIHAENLEPNRTYHLRVRGEEIDGNFSDYSYNYVSTSNDMQAPTNPPNIYWTPRSATSAVLQWSPSTDNVGVDSYLITFSTIADTGQNQFNIGNVTQYIFNNLPVNKTCYVRIYARDLAGNKSDYVQTNHFFKGLLDVQAPAAPGDVNVHYRKWDSLFVSWYEPFDNRRVTGYLLDVALDSGFVNLVPGYNARPLGLDANQTTMVTGLRPSTKYHLRVRARDAAGNTSPNSSVASAVTRPTASVPSAPTGLSLLPAYRGLVLQWNESDDDYGQTVYYLDVSVSPQFTSFVPGYQNLAMGVAPLRRTITGLQPGTRYYVRMRAGDGDGNTSAHSVPVNAVVDNSSGDTQAPGVPGNVQILRVEPTAFYFQWDPSTDNVGVADYQFDLSTDPLFATRLLGMDQQYLKKEDRLGYRITGLNPSRNYYLRLRAKDAAGNMSANSQPVTITTRPSAEAPSAPSGLSAVTDVKGMIKLVWSASNDNRGVTGYFLDVSESQTFASYANGYQNLEVASSPTLKYIGGLRPGVRYYIRLRAGDGEGNRSAPSGTVNALAGL